MTRGAKIGAGRLVAYALPALPLAALTLPVYLLIPSFYIEVMGASATAVGAALLAIRVFDAFTDPIAGYLSDLTRSRFGRRRVWMLAGAPLAGVAAYMLFAPPDGAGVGYMALWTALLTLGWTAIVIPYTAWGAELTTDYHERTRVAGVREAFLVVGTLIATATPVAAAQVVGGDRADGLEALGVMVAAALPLFVAVAAWFVPDATPASGASDALALKAAWPHVRRNGAFRRLVIAYLVNGVANGLPASLFVIFVGQALRAGPWAEALLLLYFVCGIVSIPAWLALSRRFGKHRTWCAAMLATCAVFALAPAAVYGGGVALFAVVCALTGFGFGADVTLPGAMQADVVDADEAESGAKRAGLYFALWSVATKLALAMAAAVAFPALDLFGFDARAAVQADGTIAAIVALYAIAPIALKLVAVALMWSFPIDEAAQSRLRALAEGRAAA